MFLSSKISQNDSTEVIFVWIFDHVDMIIMPIPFSWDAIEARGSGRQLSTFSQKGCLVNGFGKYFIDGFGYPSYFLFGEIGYQKNSMKYFPNPFN